MNRPINSGNRVDGVDRVDRFSVELSRFVRLDRFQDTYYIPDSIKRTVTQGDEE